MQQNYRIKNAKDTERADESLVIPGFICKIPESVNTSPKLTVTYQQNDTEYPDEFFEKKK